MGEAGKPRPLPVLCAGESEVDDDAAGVEQGVAEGGQGSLYYGMKTNAITG